MKSISFALLSDGSSDAALFHVLVWLLRQHVEPHVSVQSQWADLRRFPNSPRTLANSIAMTARLYPADVLFVHRDAEGEPAEDRYAEIDAAVEEAKRKGGCPPYLAVVPVRMQEAWLLFDEAAIRRAAGNPRGTCRLNLPLPENVESMPDPKNVLHETLRQACELRGRRLKKFNVGRATHRLAEYMESFAALRRLSAFQRLEADVAGVIRDMDATQASLSA